ncbi:MAG: RNA polymerase sigma factor, partial [Bacteroidota bacterium]
MIHLTDEALMEMVQQGDLDKMRPLFDRYHLRMYNYCLQLSGDRETSKDLTQEVFYRALKFRGTYRATSFATWLYTIARNLCYDHYKMQRRAEKETKAFKLRHEREARIPQSPPGDVNQLNAALKQLSLTDRELIVMSKYQGLKYRDIAIIINSTEGAVR